MSYKKLVPIIYLKDTKAYSDEALTNLISDDAVSVADSFSANGADEIIIMDLSYDDASHDEAIGIIRQITKALDTPVIAGGNVKRVEDVKKYLYAGAKAALLDESRESNMIMMKEVCDRFGKDKIALIYRAYDKDVIQLAKDNEIAFVFVKDGVSYKEAVADFDGIPAIVETSVLGFLGSIPAEEHCLFHLHIFSKAKGLCIPHLSACTDGILQQGTILSLFQCPMLQQHPLRRIQQHGCSLLFANAKKSVCMLPGERMPKQGFALRQLCDAGTAEGDQIPDAGKLLQRLGDLFPVPAAGGHKAIALVRHPADGIQVFRTEPAPAVQQGAVQIACD